MSNIVLGNGTTLVGIDSHAQLRDLYFPFVGLENHVGGNFKHRIGVFVDGVTSWLSDDEWKTDMHSGFETMSGETNAVNETIGIELSFEDVLYNERNIFFRQVTVKNLWAQKDKLKFFSVMSLKFMNQGEVILHTTMGIKML
jgi:GH15 family glucan-1,4-alpha-glucosidase